MNIIGGRGGPFTALFGLFAILFLLLLYLIKWFIIGSLVVLIWTGREIYRWHKRRQVRSGKISTLKAGGHWNPPTIVMSPITRKDNNND